MCHIILKGFLLKYTKYNAMQHSQSFKPRTFHVAVRRSVCTISKLYVLIATGLKINSLKFQFIVVVNFCKKWKLLQIKYIYTWQTLTLAQTWVVQKKGWNRGVRQLCVVWTSWIIPPQHDHQKIGFCSLNVLFGNQIVSEQNILICGFILFNISTISAQFSQILLSSQFCLDEVMVGVWSKRLR